MVEEPKLVSWCSFSLLISLNIDFPGIRSAHILHILPCSSLKYLLFLCALLPSFHWPLVYWILTLIISPNRILLPLVTACLRGRAVFKCFASILTYWLTYTVFPRRPADSPTLLPNRANRWTVKGLLLQSATLPPLLSSFLPQPNWSRKMCYSAVNLYLADSPALLSVNKNRRSFVTLL